MVDGVIRCQHLSGWRDVRIVLGHIEGANPSHCQQEIGDKDVILRGRRKERKTVEGQVDLILVNDLKKAPYVQNTHKP